MKNGGFSSLPLRQSWRNLTLDPVQCWAICMQCTCRGVEHLWCKTSRYGWEMGQYPSIYIYVTTVTTSYDIWSTFMYDLANCFGKYEKHFGLRWVGNPGSTLLRNFNQDIGSRTWEFQNGRTFEGCRSFGGFSQRHIMTTRYYTYNLNSNNNSNHHHHHHHDHPPHHHFLLLLHLNPSRLGAKK